jgi:hypothetical protein
MTSALSSIERELSAGMKRIVEAPKKLLDKMDVDATVWLGEQVARKGALTMLLTPLRYVEAWYWTCALRDGFVVLCGLPAPPRAPNAPRTPGGAAGGAFEGLPATPRPAPACVEERPFLSTARLICDIAIMLPRPGLGVQFPAALSALALGAGTVVTWKMARAAAAGKGAAAPAWLALGSALLWPVLAGAAVTLNECSSDIALNRGDVWAPFGYAPRGAGAAAPAAAAAAAAAAAGADAGADAGEDGESLPLLDLGGAGAAAEPFMDLGGAGAAAEPFTDLGGAGAAAEPFTIRTPRADADAPQPLVPRGFSLRVGRRHQRRRWWWVFGFSLSSAGLWSVATGVARSALETTFANAVASTIEVLRKSAPSWLPDTMVTASSLWSEGPIKAQALGALAYVVFLALSKVDAHDHNGNYHRVRLIHALMNKLDV